jgi:hypothetical protein
MAEEKEEKKEAKAGKPRASKSSGAAKKGAAKKPAKKAAKPAASEAASPEAASPEAVAPEAVEKTVEEPAAGGGPSEEYDSAPQEEKAGSAAMEEEEELSDEELRRMVEESLEKVTIGDIILNMMNQLASIGYLKMGLPETVNMKYRDFEQARLAIDILEAMVKASEGKVPEEATRAFRGTLANMQMNFVQLKSRSGT